MKRKKDVEGKNGSKLEGAKERRSEGKKEGREEGGKGKIKWRNGKREDDNRGKGGGIDTLFGPSLTNKYLQNVIFITES